LLYTLAITRLTGHIVTPQPAAPLLPRHNRILGRVTRMVTKPWHLYPVGLPFGLGFWIVGLFVAT